MHCNYRDFSEPMFLCYTDLPALIDKSPKILNQKTSVCILKEASWRIWSMSSKESFSRDEEHTIDLHSDIQTLVPDTSTVKFMA